MEGSKSSRVRITIIIGVNYMRDIRGCGEDFDEGGEKTAFSDENAGGGGIERVGKGGGTQRIIGSDDGKGLGVRCKGGLEPFCTVERTN